jgi:hypothetical protein
MPLVSTELGSQYFEPVATGPDAIVNLATFGPFPPASIPANGSFTSGVLPGDGFKTFFIGITSSEPGAITIQRFLDVNGTIVQGAANTLALTAGAPAVLSITDGLPYLTFTVTITNTSGSAATVTNFAFIMTL